MFAVTQHLAAGGGIEREAGQPAALSGEPARVRGVDPIGDFERAFDVQLTPTAARIRLALIVVAPIPIPIAQRHAPPSGCHVLWLDQGYARAYRVRHARLQQVKV